MPPVEQVYVPDIGDYSDVKISEIMVRPGDRVNQDDPLIALETDKATMEVPSPVRGIVKDLKVGAGDRVSKGSLILLIEPGGAAGAAASDASSPPAPPVALPALAPTPDPGPAASASTGRATPEAPREPAPATEDRPAYATPSVRQQARELGVDLSRVVPSGRKGRITREDVVAFVRAALSAPQAPPATGGGAGLALAPWPVVDFAKYGPVERQNLSRIRTLSGAALARNWVMIPHVTNFDEADVTDLDAFRLAVNEDHAKAGVKTSLLAFLIKAVVASLRQFPSFNASLDGDALVLKRYFHIGFAADTPRGLLVPVLRDADRKSVLDIAREIASLAGDAREGKLAPGAMQGGCFSISSLGGIGGTGFTPIINAPEVAILGVAKAAIKPVWNGTSFAPRLILPLSLSWDHRVIDGAEAARFLAHLAAHLADVRRLLL